MERARGIPSLLYGIPVPVANGEKVGRRPAVAIFGAAGLLVVMKASGELGFEFDDPWPTIGVFRRIGERYIAGKTAGEWVRCSDQG